MFFLPYFFYAKKLNTELWVDQRQNIWLLTNTVYTYIYIFINIIATLVETLWYILYYVEILDTAVAYASRTTDLW